MSGEVCPRCGKRVSSFGIKTIRGRRYLFAYHGNRPCYLGPEGLYVHAENLWKLGLTNLPTADVISLMSSAFNRYLAEVGREEDPHSRRAMVEQMREFLRKSLRRLSAYR